MLVFPFVVQHCYLQQGSAMVSQCCIWCLFSCGREPVLVQFDNEQGAQIKVWWEVLAVCKEMQLNIGF